MTPTLGGLKRAIEAHEAYIGVIGLGYVGLPLAITLAAKGFCVTGVERDAGRVELINAAGTPFEDSEAAELSTILRNVIKSGSLRVTSDYRQLMTADVVMICVETPVGSDHRPRFDALKSACLALGSVLKPGSLVIVESTLAPGTMDGLVRPLLEASTGGASRADFYLGHCPERLTPGRLLENMRSMSRTVGGQTPQATDAMLALYRQFVEGDLESTDMLTAELVKTTENAYRDVNIAFANEVAIICERLKADVWKVRDLVNKLPDRLMLAPGGGVGGHCIPKDSWLLATGFGDDGKESLLATARRINDGMPGHVAQLVSRCLVQGGLPLSEARVAILGYSYREDSGDTRNSPTKDLVDILASSGCSLRVHDPFVGEFRGNLQTALRGADCLVLMVGHSQYRELLVPDLAALMRRRIVIDARAFFNPESLRAMGFTYKRIGTGGLEKDLARDDPSRN